MHPLQIEAEAGGRHGAAEAADQIVVAAAAAEDVAQRGVVDLDDRARVVAEVTQQAEVELDAARHTLLDQQVVGLLQALRRPLDGDPAELAGLFQHLGAAPQAREPQQGLAAVRVEALHLVDGHLQSDQVVLREPVKDAGAVLTLHAELTEELAVQVGVAEAEDRPVEPDGVERRAQHLEYLRCSLWSRRAEQLDPGVEELADLPALRADGPIGVADVGEAVWRCGVREARRHQAGDRDGHVRAQGEQLAALVEEAIGADAASPLAPREHLVVFQRRRGDLAVAVALEDVDQGRLERAELAHLVRQDVPGARGNRVDHRLHHRFLAFNRLQGSWA